MNNALNLSKYGRVSIFSRPIKRSETAAELKPLINNKSFEYNHVKCQEQYFRAMDLKAMDEMSSKKQAIMILQDLFYNKMMSYETDESSYILKQHIVLNYWKLLQETRKDTNDSKMILRMLRIGYLYLNEQCIRILPKVNNLQLLSLILAKEQYAAQYYSEALNVCNQAQNMDNKLTKDKSTLLKIHYLKVKIYNQIQEPDLELKQINKCFHYLSTLTQKQKDSTYSSFRKNLIFRKQQLLSQKNSNLGVIGSNQLIGNSVYNRKQSKNTQNQKSKIRISKPRASKSESKLRKKSLSNSIQRNRTSSNNKEDQNIDKFPKKSSQPSQSFEKQFQNMDCHFQIKRNHKIKTEHTILKDKNKFPVKVFKDRIQIGLDKNKAPLKIERGPSQSFKKFNVLLRKNAQLQQILRQANLEKQQSAYLMAPYLKYFNNRPGLKVNKNKMEESRHNLLPVSKKIEKDSPLQVQRNYKCLVSENNRRQFKEEKIIQVVRQFQWDILNKFLNRANQKKQNFDFIEKQEQQDESSFLQQYQEGTNVISQEQSPFTQSRSNFFINNSDPLSEITFQMMRFILNARLGYLIRGEAKISRMWGNLQLKTVNSVAALLYSNNRNLLQEKAKNALFSIKIQGTFTLSNYLHAKFQFKLPQFYKMDDKIFNIVQEAATKVKLDKKRQNHMDEQEKIAKITEYIGIIISEAFWQKSLSLEIKQLELESFKRVGSQPFLSIQQCDILEFYRNCVRYYQQSTNIEKTKNSIFQKYFWIKRYQEYKTTFDEIKRKQQQSQKTRTTKSLKPNKHLINKSMNNKPQQSRIAYFDISSMKLQSFKMSNTLLPKVFLKKFLATKAVESPSDGKSAEMQRNFHQSIQLVSQQILNSTSVLSRQFKKMSNFFKNHRKNYNKKRQIALFNCMKYLLIQFIDQGYTQLLNFFNLQQIYFLSNISNSHYAVKILKYTAKQLYSDIGECFFKFQFSNQSSSIRKLVLILTQKEISDILGNNHKCKGFDFNNPIIYDEMHQFCKRIVIRKEYLYQAIGIRTDEVRFHSKNHFRNSHKKSKYFLEQHLNMLKIVCQKTSIIRIDHRKIFSVITISTIDVSSFYQLRIYFPSICMHYSMCFSRNIIKCFDRSFLAQVFGEQIGEQLSQQQSFKKYSRLLSQFQKNRKKTGEYWNKIIKKLQFEIVKSSYQEHLIVKIGQFRGYLKDSSIVHYFQVNRSVLRIEITLQQKETRLKIVNYNMVLLHMLLKMKKAPNFNQIVQNPLELLPQNQKTSIQKRIRVQEGIDGQKEIVDQKQSNKKQNNVALNQCVQSQLIRGISSVSEEKTGQCLVYISITNVDYEKTINFTYKLTKFLNLIKGQKPIELIKTPAKKEKQKLQQEKIQIINQIKCSESCSDSFSSQQNLQYLSEQLIKQTYNDFNQLTFSYAKILRGLQTVKQKLVDNLTNLYSVKKLFMCEVAQYNFNKKFMQGFANSQIKPKYIQKQYSSQYQHNQNRNSKKLNVSRILSFKNESFHETPFNLKKINKMIEKTSQFSTICTCILDIEKKKMSKIIYNNEKRSFQFHFFDNQNFSHKALQINLQKTGYPFISFFQKQHLKFMSKRIFRFNKNLILTE